MASLERSATESDNQAQKRNKRSYSEIEDTQDTNHKRRKISDDNKQSLNEDDEITMNEPITLNVGGIKYQTTKLTLSTASTNNVLYKMFEGNFSTKPSKDGSHFIDRDGTHFRYILNFLRDGYLNISYDRQIIKELLQEAKYYQIQPLIKELEIRNIVSCVNSSILSKEQIHQIVKYQMKHYGAESVKHWALQRGSFKNKIKKICDSMFCVIYSSVMNSKTLTII